MQDKKKISWQKVWRYLIHILFACILIFQEIIIKALVVSGYAVNIPTNDRDVTLAIIGYFITSSFGRTIEKVKNVDNENFYAD